MQLAHTPSAPQSALGTRSARLTFARHYGEMVLAMLLGMGVLGGAGTLVLEAAGVNASQWDRTAPTLLLLAMAFSMTVPMVAWMRYRGHGWAPCGEMAAAMFFPSFAALAFLYTGLVEDSGTLLAIQHAVMFPAMLGAMLIRPADYAGHGAHA